MSDSAETLSVTPRWIHGVDIEQSVGRCTCFSIPTFKREPTPAERAICGLIDPNCPEHKDYIPPWHVT